MLPPLSRSMKQGENLNHVMLKPIRDEEWSVWNYDLARSGNPPATPRLWILFEHFDCRENTFNHSVASFKRMFSRPVIVSGTQLLGGFRRPEYPHLRRRHLAAIDLTLACSTSLPASASAMPALI